MATVFACRCAFAEVSLKLPSHPRLRARQQCAGLAGLSIRPTDLLTPVVKRRIVCIRAPRQPQPCGSQASCPGFLHPRGNSSDSSTIIKSAGVSSLALSDASRLVLRPQIISPSTLVLNFSHSTRIKIHRLSLAASSRLKKQGTNQAVWPH